jgi:putative copper export protein
VLRWLEYVGLLAAVGMLVLQRLAFNPPRLKWVEPPITLAMAVALVGGAGVVGSEALRSSLGLVTFLVGTPNGWVRVARVAAEALALLLSFTGLRLVAPATLIAAAAVAFAGHASALRLMPGGIFTDALHVLSAGMWAGGILAMATVHPPGGWRGEAGRELVQRFGRVALLAFAVTAFTGVIGAAEQLKGVEDLWTTSYGLVLSAKSAAVLAMVVLSALVWTRRVNFNRTEAALALMVLAASALMAAYPMPPAAA